MNRTIPIKIAPITKAAVCLVTLIALAFPPLFAAAATQDGHEGSETRQLDLWNQRVSYQYSVVQNNTLSYDGEAYQKIIAGETVNFVVLNSAFFKREAQELLKRFRQNDYSSPEKLLNSSENFLRLENKLLALEKSPREIPSLDKGILASLKKLKASLEYLAWHDFYRETLAEASSMKQAEKIFIRRFTESRLKTIEYHEAAHILDLSKADSKTQTPDFEKFSELNAFYTELVYGDNPLDVMAQAITGLIDEGKRGEMVDFSIVKVATVLKFLNDCPDFPRNFKNGPLKKSCLEILANLQKSTFQMAGKKLYVQNFDLLKKS